MNAGDLEVVEQPLPFKVFLRTKDGKWTLKAAFATGTSAGAYVAGLATNRVEARIFEDRTDGLFEVTKDAVREAMEAIAKAERR